MGKSKEGSELPHLSELRTAALYARPPSSDRAADRLRCLARGESFELDQRHRSLCYLAVLQ